MAEVYYYSRSTGGFLPLSLKDEYLASPTGWPADALEVSSQDYHDLMSGQRRGYQIVSDPSGAPMLLIPACNFTLKAKKKKDRLLRAAHETISLWQTELMLGVLSDHDKVELLSWLKYIKELKALDISGVLSEEGYQSILWPNKEKGEV